MVDYLSIIGLDFSVFSLFCSVLFPIVKQMRFDMCIKQLLSTYLFIVLLSLSLRLVN